MVPSRSTGTVCETYAAVIFRAVGGGRADAGWASAGTCSVLLSAGHGRGGGARRQACGTWGTWGGRGRR
jgi:hypothetical protein